jgi:AcrR family transcriptional regulator
MLEAAERLTHERGFEALTVSELVQRSRTSVGSFYARFEDKAALLRAVQDRALGRLESTFDERARNRPPTASLAEAVHAAVEMFVQLVSRDAPLIRAFYAQGADPMLRKRVARTDQLHFAIFRAALLEHQGEIRHPDPERAILFAYSTHLTIALSLSWTIGTADARFSPAETAAELSRMLAAYLQGGSLPEREPRAKPRSIRKR